MRFISAMVIKVLKFNLDHKIPTPTSCFLSFTVCRSSKLRKERNLFSFLCLSFPPISTTSITTFVSPAYCPFTLI